MAILLYVKDGKSPGNITRTQDVSLQFVKDEYFGCKKRFLASPEEGLPPFNPEIGTASEDSDPCYVVLKIIEEEAGSPEFNRPGYYLVEGVTPWL